MSNPLTTRRYTDTVEKLGYFISSIARHDLVEKLSKYLDLKIEIAKTELAIKNIELEKNNEK